MRYAIYDESTGQILQWGFGEPPPGKAFILHDQTGSLAHFYVDPVSRVLLPKQQMVLDWPTNTPYTDEAVISGLPEGTSCTFMLGTSRYRTVINDGTLELSVLEPQKVSVVFWHPTHMHSPIEVGFV